jgi:hypothetical protein
MVNSPDLALETRSEMERELRDVGPRHPFIRKRVEGKLFTVYADSASFYGFYFEIKVFATFVGTPVVLADPSAVDLPARMSTSPMIQR